MKVTVEREIGGRTLTLTTGELAKQASGAVLIQFAETVVFVAAQTGPPRPGIDFFPLQVDYRERFASAGKFPGGFLKREGRPTNREILTMRLTDRPIRPLFPKGFVDEVQVMSNVLVVDGENDPDVLSIIGASAALGVAPLPFQGPIGAVRVGCVDGELVAFPTLDQMEDSTLDLVVAGSKESVLMIEGFADQLPEEEMADAIVFAHNTIKEICDLQIEFFEKVGPEKVEFAEPPENPFVNLLREEAYAKLREAKQNPKKLERYAGTDAIKDEFKERLFPDGAEENADGHTVGEFKEAFYQLERRVVRDLILEGVRVDGRAPGDLRDVSCTAGFLPRIHGSAIFTRGETQSMANLTLGTSRDTQRVDGPVEEYEKRFMLDYNFPSYSVGEVRPIRGPGRREIGHGMLAERSVEPVIPSADIFPYTIRVISDITESNGSSSMATVCSATLALMDAGVPIVQPVAGISIGVVKETDDKYTLLTDIMGDEDHFGDMDFKVAGTGIGITGIQLDLKIDGISEKIVRETLAQAAEARKVILKAMLTEIPAPREQTSQYAPRLSQIKIDPSKIGLVIGPGGKTIRSIQEETETQIDIAEDGVVTVASNQGSGAEKALALLEALTEEVRVGRVYHGTVSAVKDFGVFVEIAPGKDGLCHISELDTGFVKSVGDICKVGDKMDVKVIAVDDQNRVKLSRRALLAENEEGNGDSDDSADE
ncbi:MAG: polyribonucleotide nucleotidyltransferase [Planctomycetaceae bacterium]|nr:polyribonucleotide nucleotidyltransferase [Planctomycetaceae bacterium]